MRLEKLKKIRATTSHVASNPSKKPNPRSYQDFKNSKIVQTHERNPKTRDIE